MKETLKALREKNNYSQATVAKYLGISRQMYIKYESGEAEPPVKVIVALSKLYKVDYAQIIDNAAGSHIAKENIYDKSKISGNFCVASPSVAYGSSSPVVMNNNFELIKTIIPYMLCLLSRKKSRKDHSAIYQLLYSWIMNMFIP